MATQHVRTGLLSSLSFLEMKFSNQEIFSRGLEECLLFSDCCTLYRCVFL